MEFGMEVFKLIDMVLVFSLLFKLFWLAIVCILQTTVEVWIKRSSIICIKCNRNVSTMLMLQSHYSTCR